MHSEDSQAAIPCARASSLAGGALRGAAGFAAMCVVALLVPLAYAQPSAGIGPGNSLPSTPSLQAQGALAFDLPAQPLKNALARYDAHTSLSVFYPSELAEGKLSSPVHGVFTPEHALRRLLEGTGLAVQSVAQGAFVLLPGASAPARSHGDETPARGSLAAGGRAFLPDAELVQSRVFEALCGVAGWPLGGFRLALTVQVGDDGRVRDARLLDSTGNRARDAAVLAALRSLDIGRAPADTANPFVLLVRPRKGGSAPDACQQPGAAALPPAH